ncbi:MAG: hypothetical protein DMF60_00220 [Acidobacteria bacterium]|nr:MAG: hypothetical protein DMF60_00220 [Acidobacteriota bacterium]
MSISTLSLMQLFSISPADWSQKLSGGLDAEKGESSPSAVIMKEVPALLRWLDMRNELVKKVGELLDLDITGILIAAWNKYQVLQEYRDEKKHPLQETAYVSLLGRTIHSEHHPYIEIVRNNQRIAKLEFDLQFALTVEAVVLRVQAARIKGIQLGDMKGEITLRYRELEILNKSLPQIAAPGSIDLGEGIPIPAPAASAAH